MGRNEGVWEYGDAACSTPMRMDMDFIGYGAG